eukprot:TRINITY_DN13116_c0_g1_i1.p1 TRINITY_DN13116_c0_g1~~TRINITY_DN13116_c0_g1_i1.p1  ORF type:complete len:1084 (+),score=234.45 TRINITY_DN13116_c0_g1_i1:225-3476(+)
MAGTATLAPSAGGTTRLGATGMSHNSTLNMSQTLMPAKPGAPAGTPAVTVNYKHVLKLFEEDYAADMVERQYNAVRKVIAANQEGYHLDNLDAIARFVDIINGRVNDGEVQFADELCQLVGLAQLPFRSERASDLQARTDIIATALKSLANVIDSRSELVSGVAAETLATFARRGRVAKAKLNDEPLEGVPKQAKKERASTRDLFIPQVVALSGTVEFVLDLLAGDTLSYNKRIHCLSVLLELSYQPDLAGRIVDHQGAAILTRQLTTAFETQQPSLTIDILLGIMSLYPSALLQVTSTELLGKLKDLIETLLTRGYRQSDKELRNDVLLTALLLAGESMTHDAFFETGFSEIAVAVCAATELKLEHPCIRSINNTTSAEDYDMKIILIQLVSRLSIHDDTLTLITQMDIVLALLQFLDFGKTMPCHINKWNPLQLHKLQMNVLHFLWQVGPLADLEYQGCGANGVVMQFLLDSRDPELRHATLRVLKETAGIDQSFKTEIGVELEGVKHLLAITSDTQEDLQTRQLACSVLSTLVKDSFANQNLLAEHRGVEVIIESLQWQAATTDAAGQLVFLTNLIDLLWNGVVGNESNETEFLELEGLHSLMVMIETCPRLMRNQLLGVLSDLLINDEALADYQEWQSAKTRRYAMQVMMSIWNEDEQRLRTADPGGVIQSFVTPLGIPASHVTPVGEGPTLEDGKEARKRGSSRASLVDSPRSVKSYGSTARSSGAAMSVFGPGDLAGSLLVHDSTSNAIHKAISPETVTAVYEDDIRAKVYAIFHRCGFDNAEYLDTIDRVRLLKVQNYIPFKEMEIRHDNAQQLEAQKIRPVTPDREKFTARQLELQELAADVKEEQIHIKQEAHEQDLLDETHHIEEINQKQAALQESVRIQTEKEERVKMRRKDPTYDRITDCRVVRMQDQVQAYIPGKSRAQSQAVTIPTSRNGDDDGDDDDGADIEHAMYETEADDIMGVTRTVDIDEAGDGHSDDEVGSDVADPALAQTAPAQRKGTVVGDNSLGVTMPTGRYTFASAPGSVQVRDRKRRPREKLRGNDTLPEKEYVHDFLQDCHDVPHVDLFHFTGQAST